MTDDLPPAAADPDQLPRHTTPTWEVELLISGVAVFAMLQLPGWLDDRMFALLPRFDADWTDMLQLTYFYLKCAAIILAVTFSLHLFLRAHWIALVGMHSVHHGQTRWQQQRMGPVQRSLEAGRQGSAEAAIERADNRATTVFAIGVTLATNLLTLCVVVVIAFVLALLYQRLTGVHARTVTVMTVCITVIVMPSLLLKLADRYFGDRLWPDGVAHRTLTAMMRFYNRVGFGRRSSPMALLSGRGGQTLQAVLFAAIFMGLITLVMFQMDAMKSPWRLGSYQLFPRTVDDVHRIDGAHYDDQRDPLHDPLVPYVQGAIVEGPYLQLMVPYQPGRDTAALQRSCAAHGGDAVLDCLARLHAVTLDGVPVAALHYDASSDPRTQRPALLAMIDVRALAPGRHRLQVARGIAAAGKPHDAADDDVITFWR